MFTYSDSNGGSKNVKFIYCISLAVKPLWIQGIKNVSFCSSILLSKSWVVDNGFQSSIDHDRLQYYQLPGVIDLEFSQQHMGLATINLYQNYILSTNFVTVL